MAKCYNVFVIILMRNTMYSIRYVNILQYIQYTLQVHSFKKVE